MIDLLPMLASASTNLGGPADIWQHIVADFSNITSPSALAAFIQVLLIDLVLAGDNAIVVGALAAGLPAEQRKKVILIGVLAALVLRIAFALVVTQLMAIVGLIFFVRSRVAFSLWAVYFIVNLVDVQQGMMRTEMSSAACCCSGWPGACGANCATAVNRPVRPKWRATNIPVCARPRALPVPPGLWPSLMCR